MGRADGHCSSQAMADRSYLGFVRRVTWGNQHSSQRGAGAGEFDPKPRSVESVYTRRHWGTGT